MIPQMVNGKINFKPDLHAVHKPNDSELERPSTMAINRNPKKEFGLPNAPNKTKVHLQTEFETLGAGNPYNTMWFRKVLKNHFDVDLAPIQQSDNPSGTKWRIRRVKNSRKSQRPSREDELVGQDNKDFISTGYSQLSTKNGGFNFQKGNERKSSGVKNQPAVNNFMGKVEFLMKG